MSEIEKMYKNANVKKHLAYFECHRGRSSMRCCPINSDDRDEECSSCFFRDKMKEVYEYPPFTAEKQLKLIKWLAINKEDFGIHYRDYDDEYRWVCGCEFEVEVYRIFNEDETFEESLVGLINMLWQNKIFSLTEEEKKQIKEILA